MIQYGRKAVQIDIRQCEEGWCFEGFMVGGGPTGDALDGRDGRVLTDIYCYHKSFYGLVEHLDDWLTGGKKFGP